MRFFFKYISLHVKSVLFFILSLAVFATTFYLFNIPIVAILYASAICAFTGLCMVISDCISLYRHHTALKIAYKEYPIAGTGLPLPRDIIEEDYQNIIQTLYSSRQEVINSSNLRYTDMSEYYAVWVHQIKTPISSMRLILQGHDDSTSRQLSDDLQRIEQYVDMALCYVRLDSLSTDYVIRSYELDTIIKQAVRRYASQFIYRKITLEYNPSTCMVLTDEKWLLFVIEQIISNALKYTRSGTVSIYLESDKVLCISDTGIGISPEDLPRIFDKGYTGYNGRDDKKATGLGLYLCHRICTNLGHRISASSVLGQGTIIRLDLKSVELKTE